MLQTNLRGNKIQTRIPVQTQSIKNLKSEVNLLRSFIISIIGEDKEGNYNPRFTEEILKAAEEKPTNSFHNSKSFLKQLRSV